MEEINGEEQPDRPLDDPQDVLTEVASPNFASPASEHVPPEQVPSPHSHSRPPQLTLPQSPVPQTPVPQPPEEHPSQETASVGLPPAQERLELLTEPPFLSRQHDAAGPSGEPVQEQPESHEAAVGQRKSSSRARAASQRRWRDESVEQEPRKRARGAQGEGGQAVARHIVTEQQRRDREKAGFAALRDLVPMEEKLDKATFLKRVCSYISNLQVRLAPACVAFP